MCRHSLNRGAHATAADRPFALDFAGGHSLAKRNNEVGIIFIRHELVSAKFDDFVARREKLMKNKPLILMALAIV